MNAKFYPQVLSGKTEAQAFKSLAMRYFTLAFFAKGKTKIYLKNEAEDFSALKDALRYLGADINRENSVYTVSPPNLLGQVVEADVKSSLLAFRFLLPMLASKFERIDFYGSGKLTRKDITVGMNVLKGITLGSKTLPMPTSGKLNFGEFMIEPEVNSQLVCSLIMALPMLEGDSVVRFREKPKKQLACLINLTVNAMNEFGVKVDKKDAEITVRGNQEYIAPSSELIVEGDYSTAGYFLAINNLGGKVEVDNLNENSIQPEREIVNYLYAIANEQEIELKGKTDYIFLLTAIASAMPRKTIFTKMKIKEKDKQKFAEFILMLQRLGAEINFEGETLTVMGKQKLSGGVMLDTLGDARVAMSLITVVCAMDSPVTMLSVESAMLEQSSFINEFIKLNGKCQTV